MTSHSEKPFETINEKDTVQPEFSQQLSEIFVNAKNDNEPLIYRAPHKYEGLKKGLEGVTAGEIAKNLEDPDLREKTERWRDQMKWLIGHELLVRVTTQQIVDTRPGRPANVDEKALTAFTSEMDNMVTGSSIYGGDSITRALDFFAATRLAIESNDNATPQDKLHVAEAFDKLAARAIVETYMRSPAYDQYVPRWGGEGSAQQAFIKVASLGNVESNRRQALTAMSDAIKECQQGQGSEKPFDKDISDVLKRIIALEAAL